MAPEMEMMPKDRSAEIAREVVADYLKYGSVDEVLAVRRYSIPMSFASIHRLLDDWGVVKSLGRSNRPLTDGIGFLVRLIESRIPLERLYKRMPPSFTPSVTTLHRMYNEAKREVREKLEEKERRRFGSALVITPKGRPNSVLIGRDISPPRLDVGKPIGAFSLPMGFSVFGEPRKNSALRILQQEVFTNHVIEKKMPPEVIDVIEEIDPFMFLDIADVRVAVFHLELPENLSDLANFSSFKLKNYSYEDAGTIAQEVPDKTRFRQGIIEIAQGYLKYLAGATTVPFFTNSFLNVSLAGLVLKKA